jgi:hypothetical protein
VGASVADSESLNVYLVFKFSACVVIMESKIGKKLLFKQSGHVNTSITFSSNVSLSVLEFSEDTEELQDCVSVQDSDSIISPSIIYLYKVCFINFDTFLCKIRSFAFFEV